MPAVGCSRSAIRRSSVVFPHPEGPMKETNSPSAIGKFTLESASTLPSAVSKVSETSRTSTANGRLAEDTFVSLAALAALLAALCIGLTTRKSPPERAGARAPLSLGTVQSGIPTPIASYSQAPAKLARPMFVQSGGKNRHG